MSTQSSVLTRVNECLSDLPNSSSKAIATGCLVCAMGLSTSIATADAPASFYDDFESGDTEVWNYTGLWGRSSSVTLQDLGGEHGFAAKATAEGKGQRIGKAYLTKDMQQALQGDRIEASMLVYFPYLRPRSGSVYLMDVECRDCGYAEKPGLRVLVDSDGFLRVNRSKLGIAQDLGPTPSGRIPFNQVFRLTLIVDLGGELDGRTQVYIDDKLVIDEIGINMPLTHIAEPLGVSLTAERFDYVQFGVTANGRSDSVTIYFDDVEIDAFPGS